MPTLEAICSATRAVNSAQDACILIWSPKSAATITTLKNCVCPSPHALAHIPQQGSVTGSSMFNAGIAVIQHGRALIHIYSLGLSNQHLAKIVISEHISTISAHPSGHYIIGTGESGVIYLWETATGVLLTSWEAHYLPIRCSLFSPNGDLFVSAGDDNTIKVWSLAACLQSESSSEIKPLFIFANAHTKTITDLKFSKASASDCSQRLFSSSLDSSCKIWDLTTGECLGTIVFPSPITSIIIDQVESRIWSSGENGKIYKTLLYTPSTNNNKIAESKNSDSNGKYMYTPMKALNGSKPYDPSLNCLEGHLSKVNCIDISFDGSLLVSGDESGLIIVWDSVSGQPIRRFDGHRQNAVTSVKFILVPSVLEDPELAKLISSGSTQESKSCVKIGSNTRVAKLWGRVGKKQLEKDGNNVYTFDENALHNENIDMEEKDDLIYDSNQINGYVNLLLNEKGCNTESSSSNEHSRIQELESINSALYKLGIEMALKLETPQ